MRIPRTGDATGYNRAGFDAVAPTMTSSDDQLLPDTRKRFVAGAKCPQCQALDKIMMFRRDGVQHQECVSCGYHAEMAFEQNFRELETRVNRTDEDKTRDVSPIKFV